MQLLSLLAVVLALAGALLARDQSGCPPCDCFNCNDPDTPCLNGGVCEEKSGRCKGCPSGFAGGDCGRVLCGSLRPASGERPALGDGQGRCECDAGWLGVNCNVCADNGACQGLFKHGVHSTCYQGPVMQRRAFKSCGVILPALYQRLLKDKPANVTTECIEGKDKGFLDCRMQFWLDFDEQFWCTIQDCTMAKARMVNVTSYGCAKVSCGCVHGASLCTDQPAGMVNLQPMLEQVVGPASLECNTEGVCTFKERTMNDYFAGGIELQCRQGECMRVEDQPPMAVPGDWAIVLYIVISTMVITFVLLAAFSLLRERPSLIVLESPEEETRRLMESHVPATVAFRDLSYKLDSFSEHLLRGVCGVVNPGEVMAIIGGSGAGKTTCLDMLAQKHKRGLTTGDVLVNTNRVRRGAMAEMCGFVDQETKLFGTLTVEETLMYSAMLRLPRSMSVLAKRLRVRQTMEELGIEHLAHKRIGTAGRRGLSGGEQRRVSIANELVTAPRILFLDEPTSGLDAHSAFSTVEALVRMARLHNRTIIMTIHQPRSNIFNLCDRLLLLASGRMVFSGPVEEAAAHFAGLGYSVPNGFNTADYLIDITMDASVQYSQGHVDEGEGEGGGEDEGERGEGEEAGEERPLLEQSEPDGLPHNVLKLFNRQGKTLFNRRNTQQQQQPQQRHQPTELTKRIAFLEDEFVRSEAGQNLLATLPTTLGICEDIVTTERASLIDQFTLLTSRHWKTMIRDPLLIAPSYLLTLALALLVSLLFSSLTNDMPGVQNRLGALFFQCAYFAFAGMTVVEEWGGGGVQRAVFVRERAGACYSLLMYYASRTVIELGLLRIVPPVLYTCICYFWIGFYPKASSFGRHVLATVLFTMATSSLLQVIALCTTSASLASLLSTLLLLFSLLFGGFLLNKDHIPGLFKWLPRLSPFNYAFEALVVNELREISLKDDTMVDIEIPGRIILKQFGFDAEAYQADVCALLGILIAGVALGFVVLKAFVREKR